MSGHLSCVNGDVEIRKLKSISPSHSTKLIRLLDENDSWKLLMSVVPKVLQSYPEQEEECKDKKYTTDHIRLIENASKKDPRTPAEIFLFEWSTTGRLRPTMAHLLALLKSANLYRAADYIAIDVLNQRPVDRPLTGPAAKINILSLDEELEDDDAVNGNANPHASNVTIENNLDNSKPQNTLFSAGGAKLMAGRITQVESTRPAETALVRPCINVPIVEITSATDSCNIQDISYNSQVNLPNNIEIVNDAYEVGGIVLQSPPLSQENSMDSNHLISRPNLSDLLGMAQFENSEQNRKSPSCETISTAVSTSEEIGNRPNISTLLQYSGSNISSINNGPNLSGLLQQNFSSSTTCCHQESSETSISSSDYSISDGQATHEFKFNSEEISRPNFSGLLGFNSDREEILIGAFNDIPNLSRLMEDNGSQSKENIIPPISELLTVVSTDRNDVSITESTSSSDTD